MTTVEAIIRLTEIAQSQASMDRTNGLRIETYRHREAEGWEEGETAWEVSFYCGETNGHGGNVTATRKNLDEAVSACVGEARSWIKRDVERHNREAAHCNERSTLAAMRLGRLE